MQNRLSLVVFLAVMLVGGGVIGIMTAPGDWYAGLVKPPYNPPNWIFGPVWTTLYVLIAVAGWRIWRGGFGGWAMPAWFAQLALNFVWSPTFFAAHRVDLAFGVIVLLLAAIVVFIVSAWPRDRVAAWLFVPYAAWVGFATLLNGSILYLNM